LVLARRIGTLVEEKIEREIFKLIMFGWMRTGRFGIEFICKGMGENPYLLRCPYQPFKTQGGTDMEALRKSRLIQENMPPHNPVQKLIMHGIDELKTVMMLNYLSDPMLEKF
jgi:hypothetical protein